MYVLEVFTAYIFCAISLSETMTRIRESDKIKCIEQRKVTTVINYGRLSFCKPLFTKIVPSYLGEVIEVIICQEKEFHL